jgi:hypothetical protein
VDSFARGFEGRTVNIRLLSGDSYIRIVHAIEHGRATRGGGRSSWALKATEEVEESADIECQ